MPSPISSFFLALFLYGIVIGEASLSWGKSTSLSSSSLRAHQQDRTSNNDKTQDSKEYQDANKISAKKILEFARQVPITTSLSSPLELEGKLRQGKEEILISLKLQGDKITYQLGHPPQKITLRLQPESSSLQIPQGLNRYSEIAKTGMTYDDLGLGFLYWPSAHLETDSSLRAQPCWIITVKAPPSGLIQDSHATLLTSIKIGRLWIDKNNGALLRMEGLNKNGRLVKRIEILSAQKIRGYWTLKEMRLEKINPLSAKVEDRSYLTVHPKNSNLSE